MALHDAVGQAVRGLRYELVDLDRTGGGLLRVTIDWPWVPGQERFITAEDCERVTRQLQFVLEVEGVDYARLEVSSPGLDRPLRDERDFERFAGESVDLVLRAPIGAAAGSGVSALRKKFRGRLERSESGWRLIWSDAPPAQAGRPGRKKAPVPELALDFVFGDVAQAKLVPVVDFKGRKPKGAPVSGQVES
ncbi:MAG: ribosome maturation factor RimP [Betaproteobacteria bacterium]